MELVKGMGVFIHCSVLAEVKRQGKTATKLMRKLMDKFFSVKELATKTACSLDQQIVEAIWCELTFFYLIVDMKFALVKLFLILRIISKYLRSVKLPTECQ